MLEAVERLKQFVLIDWLEYVALDVEAEPLHNHVALERGAREDAHGASAPVLNAGEYLDATGFGEVQVEQGDVGIERVRVPPTLEEEINGARAVIHDDQ